MAAAATMQSSAELASELRFPIRLSSNDRVASLRQEIWQPPVRLVKRNPEIRGVHCASAGRLRLRGNWSENLLSS
jgi:hypothetical protein